MKKFALILACALFAAPLANAGPVSGSGSKVDYAFGGGDTTYQIAFVGGEATGVFVNGDGSSVLDVAVYDEAGNLVAGNLGNAAGCTVIWMPASTGVYTVVVINEGSNLNLFTIDIV